MKPLIHSDNRQHPAARTAGEASESTPVTRKVLRAFSKLANRLIISPTKIRRFQNTFELIPAHTPELLEESYKIRYAVYVDELGFEQKNEHPDKLEHDQYDPCSLHVLLRYKATGQYVGTIRVVFPGKDDPERPLPFEACCLKEVLPGALTPGKLSRDSFAEISRLAVLPAFRQQAKYKHSNEANRDSSRLHAALFLYLAAATIALCLGMTAIFAVMKPGLAGRLRLLGFRFIQAGKVVDHHGERAVFSLAREDFVADMTHTVKDFIGTVKQNISNTGWCKPGTAVDSNTGFD